MIESEWQGADGATKDSEDPPSPGRPAPTEDARPLDDAPVPPLTSPEDTEGG